MANSITRGYSFGATESVTNTKLHEMIDNATVTIDTVGASASIGAAPTITGPITMSQNSDTMAWSLDGSDATLKWSDGKFYLTTDEGTNTATDVIVKGKGTGSASIEIVDGSSANDSLKAQVADTTVSIKGGSAITKLEINPDKFDTDIVFSGDGETNLLVLDAGTDSVSIGGTSVDATGRNVLVLNNGTAPAAQLTNAVQLYSEDTAAENTATLGIHTEQDVEDIGTFTASHKLKVIINGDEYHISLDAV